MLQIPITPTWTDFFAVKRVYFVKPNTVPRDVTVLISKQGKAMAILIINCFTQQLT
jgi:hypothetical protein